METTRILHIRYPGSYIAARTSASEIAAHVYEALKGTDPLYDVVEVMTDEGTVSFRRHQSLDDTEIAVKNAFAAKIAHVSARRVEQAEHPTFRSIRDTLRDKRRT